MSELAPDAQKAGFSPVGRKSESEPALANGRAKEEDSERDPLWYKDALIYELHLRAFADSNADGIGDVRGLVDKLDYLSDLGVTALWLLPFYPSPLRDDGYDISDYTSVHPDYGTLSDFRLLIAEAHERKLKIIIELVLNHTSDKHPWFQRARQARPGSARREFYVWSETADRYRGTRIIFRDFETSNWTWDQTARAYYWHRFYFHQPDLNYDHPAVQRAILRVVDFWLGLGVDGLRLDGIPYLFEREGTSSENLPETHGFLRLLRAHVDQRFPNRMLLGEANQWPEDAVAYFGRGDECHMAFHFPLMPRMFMAARMEDRFPVVDILKQTPAIPDACQWALFLRNHDELTLEMVTDEERDYMYRVYAADPRARINLGIRRRLAPLFNNDRRRIELMNGLLLSFPGTPVLYYGDEIGMGDNIHLGDRNSVRTPMQWSADRNAGFSRANAQSLYLPVNIDPEYHYERLNVEAELGNPHSLLWWMRRTIALRRRHVAFGRGAMELLQPDNRKILAFIRTCQDEEVLVVANLSRFAQFVRLDLGTRRGLEPIELFGRGRFPVIESAPYLLTLGPHAFYWFALTRPEALVAGGSEGGTAEAPAVQAPGGVDAVLSAGDHRIDRALGLHLQAQRWYRGKERPFGGASLIDVVTLPAPSIRVALVRASYGEGEAETYCLPLAILNREQGAQFSADHPREVVARVAGGEEESLIVNALAWTPGISALFQMIEHRRRARGEGGEIQGMRTAAYRRLRGTDPLPDPSPAAPERRNSSGFLGNRLMLKLYRAVEPGPNPEVELGQYLSVKAGFPHVPTVAGYLEYRPAKGPPWTLAVLQAFAPNEGTAWSHALDELERFLEQAMSAGAEVPIPPAPPRAWMDAAAVAVPAEPAQWIGTYLDAARLLGRRTAELHLALAAEREDPALAPEPFTLFYQRSLYQSMRNRAERALEVLRRKLPDLDPATRPNGDLVLSATAEILIRFARVRNLSAAGLRLRVHGDYHLGEVLRSGSDFTIIDFEGEPALALSARRIKRSPLYDVAGMLCSFGYAGWSALREEARTGLLSRKPDAALRRWVRVWTGWTAAAFLRSYLDSFRPSDPLPGSPQEIGILLDCYVLEKALDQLERELHERPDLAEVPLSALAALLAPEE